MFQFICGKVTESGENYLVLENNGVGYFINASLNTLRRLGETGKTAQVYTYMAVKEDDISLYGFADREEKQFFLKLITISGIGPKLAITVLSGIGINELALAIMTGDIAAISKVKGVGKKTAERIVLELREKIDASGELPAGVGGAVSGGINEQAAEALSALGIPRAEAAAAVSRAGAAANVEELITKALKSLK